MVMACCLYGYGFVVACMVLGLKLIVWLWLCSCVNGYGFVDACMVTAFSCLLLWP